jgi:hypothetical protein
LPASITIPPPVPALPLPAVPLVLVPPVELPPAPARAPPPAPLENMLRLLPAVHAPIPTAATARDPQASTRVREEAAMRDYRHRAARR